MQASLIRDVSRRFSTWLSGPAADALGAADVAHQVHFEFLRNVSHKSARLFAEGFVRHNHVTDLSWLGLHPFADGYVVEIHEGGSGQAYWPTLAAMFETQAKGRDKDAELSVVLETSSMRQVLVEVSAGGVSALMLSEIDRREPSRLEDVSTPQRLNRLHDDWGLRAVKLALVGTTSAALLVPLALIVRPSAHVVELAKAATVASQPLATLQSVAAGPDEVVARLEFSEGKWSHIVEKRPASTLPSLRTGTQHDVTR